jgi:hypothetical protein
VAAEGGEKIMKNLNAVGLTILGLIASLVPANAAVINPPPATVPEGGQTMLLLGVGLVAVLALRYKLAK